MFVLSKIVMRFSLKEDTKTSIFYEVAPPICPPLKFTKLVRTTSLESVFPVMYRILDSDSGGSYVETQNKHCFDEI